MDNKTKQNIGIGVGVISVGSVLGFWYYTKIKKQRELEELMEEGESDVQENYQNDRPTLKKLKSAIVNKLYPHDYKPLSKNQQKLIDDLEEYEKKHARNRGRFTVYDSNRFQVLETMGDKGVETRGTNRFRVSGNIHKRTGGGYGRNMNNRNANFSDLDIY